MELLTHTRTRIFRECQRKHQLTFVERLRPVHENEALRFGSLFDSAASEWDRTGHDLEAALRLASKTDDPFESARARALIQGYHCRWVDVPMEIVAVQPEFRAPLRNPTTGRRSSFWQLGGKLDAIVRQEGRLLVFERKTTSDNITPGSDYWKRLRLDGQVSIYFDGAAALGHQVDGCIYDVTAKPGLRPLQVNKQRKTAETPAEYERRILEDIEKDADGYFGRIVVVRLERELADARWDLWQLARQIRTGQKEGHAPKNPEACTRFGTCWAFPLCTGESGSDDRIRFRIVDNVHPELT